MSDSDAMDVDVRRVEKRGCAALGIVLLLLLGGVQVVALAGALLDRPDPDVPSLGFASWILAILALWSGGTAFALLVAASPRGIAPRWLRLMSGVIGAVLHALVVIAFWRVYR